MLCEQHNDALHGEVDSEQNERGADEAHRSLLAVLVDSLKFPDDNRRGADFDEGVQSEPAEGD
jgi:hypothetical protein